MWRHIQAYIVVTVMTLLIWILAESESVTTQSLRVDVVLAADGDGRRILQLEPNQPFAGSVVLGLQGATARIDQLTRELRSAIRLVPPMPGLPADPGTHRVDLRAVLRAVPAIRDSGVTITEVDPAFVTVSIDDVVTREARVVPRAPEGSIVGAATAAPGTVTLRLPSRLAAALPPVIELPAPVDRETISSLPEGKYATIPNVGVAIPESLARGPGSEFVQVDPPRVSVALTPRSRVATAVLTRPVPVQLLLPPTELARWDITLAESDRLIYDVTVTGPDELVEQVRSERLAVVAVVALTYQELEQAARAGEPLVKEVAFSLLPGQLRFEAKDKSVTLTVRPRSPEAGGEPGPGVPPAP
jgi:hypothetical protein